MAQKQIEILILDDDPLIHQSLTAALPNEYRVHCLATPGEAEALLNRRSIDLAILDLNLPGSSGLQILKKWKEAFADLEILFCSGESKVERAVECLRHGASDYIVKPFSREDLLLIVQRALEKRNLRRTVEKLGPLIHPHPIEFIGESKPMKDVGEKVALLKHQAHLNVLILGESGTGKEVIARLLHQQEKDSQRPFVVVNMPAFPPP